MSLLLLTSIFGMSGVLQLLLPSQIAYSCFLRFDLFLLNEWKVPYLYLVFTKTIRLFSFPNFILPIFLAIISSPSIFSEKQPSKHFTISHIYVFALLPLQSGLTLYPLTFSLKKNSIYRQKCFTCR